MSIKQLLNILPQPKGLDGKKGSISWSEIEKKFGTLLPKDYKAFIELYDTGLIDHFIWVYSPFVDDENVNIFLKLITVTESYKFLKENFPEDYIHDMFPIQGGLLPWGHTTNGDELFWLTEGVPDEWSIIVYETRSSEYYKYSMSLTEFLTKVLNQELICEAFPEDFPSTKPSFLPLNML